MKTYNLLRTCLHTDYDDPKLFQTCITVPTYFHSLDVSFNRNRGICGWPQLEVVTAVGAGIIALYSDNACRLTFSPITRYPTITVTLISDVRCVNDVELDNANSIIQTLLQLPENFIYISQSQALIIKRWGER